MIEFGETLRKTREQKGLTTSQVAQTTHLLVQQIEALEREDFSKIAAPIYGRGFVKLYCEALGLDHKPFVEEFMAIYTGSKLRPIRRRMPTAQPVAPQPAEQSGAVPPAAAPAAPVEPPAPAVSADAPTVAIPQPQPPAPQPPADAPTMAAAGPVAAEPATAATEALDPSCFNFARMDDPPPPPPAPAEFTLESEPVKMPQARHSYPQQRPRHDQPSFRPPTKLDHYNGKSSGRGILDMVPPSAWRMLVLVVVGLLVLWGLFAGIKAIYRASMGPGKQNTEQTTAGEQPTAAQPSGGEARPAANAAGAQAQARPPAATGKKAEAPRPARSNRKPLPVPPLYID